MRRLSILAAAVAACILFTACPHKPTDEPADAPVTIPDGLYQETARYIRIFHPDSATSMFIDSVFTTQVIISQGDFIYPDMCKDTAKILLGKYVYYVNHFIYDATPYCWDNSVPALIADGYVRLSRPRFRDLTVNKSLDTSYVYRARVSRTEDGYTFRQVHHFIWENEWSDYDISHTLRQL